MRQKWTGAIFHATVGPSLNFRRLPMWPGAIVSTSVKFVPSIELPSISIPYLVAGRPSVNFRQISLRHEEPSSNSDNFPCLSETFHELPSTIRAGGRLSFKFLCIRKTFCHFPKTSVNVSCSQKTFCHFPSNFRDPRRSSVGFHQLSVQMADLPSTFGNFSNGRQIFY